MAFYCRTQNFTIKSTLTKIFASVSNELAWSWSHAFWVSNDEKITKHFACPSKNSARKDKKKKKSKKGYCKAFCVTRKRNKLFYMYFVKT